jgi:hypothetical protein
MLSTEKSISLDLQSYAEVKMNYIAGRTALIRVMTRLRLRTFARVKVGL